MPINIQTDIDIPDEKGLSLRDMAKVIRNIDFHVAKLKDEHKRIEKLGDRHKAQLFLRGVSGSNKEEREANFKLQLDNDILYPQIEDELLILDQKINQYRIESEYYGRLFRAKEVKEEQINASANMFGAFPKDLSDPRPW